MSFICLAVPVALTIQAGRMGIKPRGKLPKNLLQLSTIAVGLYVGLPMSVAIFPPVSVKKGPQLEERFHIHDKIYFNKGL